MSEQRLIDANELVEEICKHEGCFGTAEGNEPFMAWEVEDYINDMETIDPETLPIVQELRAKLERYEKAEHEGRLLTLPCEIGDNIYVIPSKVNYDLNKISHPENNRIYEQPVSGFYICSNNDYLLKTCDGFCSVLASYFGNTWFLTREEAEAALKARENDEIMA